MTPLRTQLDAARKEYEALTFPGDLAADVLPLRQPLAWRRWTLLGVGFGAGSLAAAAAIVLTVIHFAATLGPTKAEQPGMISQVTAFPEITIPAEFSHLATVPYEQLRTTLRVLGLPIAPSQSSEEGKGHTPDASVTPLDGFAFA